MYNDIISWIKKDYKEYKLRFVVEVTAWVISIFCTILMALTVPHPPFMLLYPLFILQCSMLAWAAYSRNSTGIFANYLLIAIIDVIALIRLFMVA
jgi:hypothetical protein